MLTIPREIRLFTGRLADDTSVITDFPCLFHCIDTNKYYMKQTAEQTDWYDVTDIFRENWAWKKPSTPEIVTPFSQSCYRLTVPTNATKLRIKGFGSSAIVYNQLSTFTGAKNVTLDPTHRYSLSGTLVENQSTILVRENQWLVDLTKAGVTDSTVFSYYNNYATDTNYYLVPCALSKIDRLGDNLLPEFPSTEVFSNYNQHCTIDEDGWIHVHYSGTARWSINLFTVLASNEHPPTQPTWAFRRMLHDSTGKTVHMSLQFEDDSLAGTGFNIQCYLCTLTYENPTGSFTFPSSQYAYNRDLAVSMPAQSESKTIDTKFRICFRYAEQEELYTPHLKDQVEIPFSWRTLTDYGYGVRNVYNEVVNYSGNYVRRVKTVTFNGSEAWEETSCKGDDYQEYRVAVSPGAEPDGAILCSGSYFCYEPDTSVVNSYRIDPDGYISFTVGTDVTSDWTTWLASNNIDCVYQLDDVIVENIEPQTIEMDVEEGDIIEFNQTPYVTYYDLGELNWTLGGGTVPYFITSEFRLPSAFSVAWGESDVFQSVPYTIYTCTWTITDNLIGVMYYSSIYAKIVVHATEYSTAAEFKAAMSGHKVGITHNKCNQPVLTLPVNIVGEWVSHEPIE